ncbi:TRAP transporter small permease, partial [Desulfovibrio sp.]
MLRFLDTRLEEMLGALLLAVMVTIAFVNVVVRYCTPFSFAWTEELTINFFVWIVLLGSARSFRDGSHLGMSILYDALPKSLRFCCYLLSMALCLGFFGALAWTGWLEVRDEYELEV